MSMTPSELAAYYDQSYPASLLTPVPDPTIGTLVPATGSAAAGPITVTVNGTNFIASAVVEVDQVAVPTTFVSATQLTAVYDPTTVGTAQFTVRQGPEESNSSPFTITALTADDVSAWTIDDVKAFIVAHPDLLAEVFAFEKAGKARVTLLEWLQALLDEEAAKP